MEGRRFARTALTALVVAGVVTIVGGCLIAEPSGDLPRLPERRPTIVRGSVVPSASRVLATFPAKFIVPVELSDPTATFQWSAFIDYNAFTGAGLVAISESQFEPSSLRNGTRILEIPLAAPLDLDQCHVVEVVVALRLAGTREAVSAHTPDEPGGDSVSWFYSPGGDLAGCPALDAGLEPRPDASADAEGGPR